MRVPKSFSTVVAIAALFLLCGGCASWVTVTQVTPDNPKVKGLRYSLATPYLLVTPANDGTMTYQWLSLPDAGKQYAVQVHSLLSTYSLELSLEHTILTKVSAKPNSSAVAADAMTQAGSVFEAKAKASTKEREDAAAAAKAARDKLKESLANAESAERQAAVSLAKAKAKDDVLRAQNPPDKDKTFEADLNLQLAQIDHDAAEKEVERIKALSAVADVGGKTANTAANTGTDSGPGAPSTWGPLLFRVVQTDGKITLQAVNQQDSYKTYGERAGAASAPAALEFAANWNSADKSLTLKASDKLPSPLKPERFRLNRGDQPFETKMTVKSLKNDSAFTVNFNPSLTKGEYTLQLAFQDSVIAAKPSKFTVP